jgi:hypothetical protein
LLILLRQEIYELTIQADYICIFTASILLCYSLSAFVFTKPVTLALVAMVATIAVYVVRAL